MGPYESAVFIKVVAQIELVAVIQIWIEPWIKSLYCSAYSDVLCYES